jgi:hypothetical protein
LCSRKKQKKVFHLYLALGYPTSTINFKIWSKIFAKILDVFINTLGFVAGESGSKTLSSPELFKTRLDAEGGALLLGVGLDDLRLHVDVVFGSVILPTTIKNANGGTVLSKGNMRLAECSPVVELQRYLNDTIRLDVSSKGSPH